ncbi:MAG TPA: bifunctional 4-hydroxy-2-oxoglutarate aldolase/2-dehydro-3-deoxy-phosphogluconate aldolase [Bryobacteraceae bacterium]|nr:bifunctional 4-hydroxy-2-oxoglutarate aldolase/2-dehydro-3-deoxy-phosphogluconate aldolase [Bryobacteraceae bacterium]
MLHRQAASNEKTGTRRDAVRAAIDEVGIVPIIRDSSPEDAVFAAESLQGGGIPIVEVTMTVPGAIKVLLELTTGDRELIVGAGSVLDVEMARECMDAGAMFLASAGFDREIVEFAAQHDLVVVPGAMTPTEIMAAWKARPDFIRVFPCSNVGGASYIRDLRRPFPHLPLIAAGGVNQQTAGDFFQAGASAISLGGELLPREAIDLRQEKRILELARRYRMIARHHRIASAVN